MKYVYNYITTVDDYFTFGPDMPDHEANDCAQVLLTGEQLDNLRTLVKGLNSVTVAAKVQLRVDYNFDEEWLDDAFEGCCVPENGVWLEVSKTPGQSLSYSLIIRFHHTHLGILDLSYFNPPLHASTTNSSKRPQGTKGGEGPKGT